MTNCDPECPRVILLGINLPIFMAMVKHELLFCCRKSWQCVLALSRSHWYVWFQQNTATNAPCFCLVKHFCFWIRVHNTWQGLEGQFSFHFQKLSPSFSRIIRVSLTWNLRTYVFLFPFCTIYSKPTCYSHSIMHSYSSNKFHLMRKKEMKIFYLMMHSTHF